MKITVAGDAPATYADPSALERDFGVTPRITPREGLRKLLSDIKLEKNIERVGSLMDIIKVVICMFNRISYYYDFKI